jgi:hypothetical protein
MNNLTVNVALNPHAFEKMKQAERNLVRHTTKARGGRWNWRRAKYWGRFYMKWLERLIT